MVRGRLLAIAAVCAVVLRLLFRNSGTDGAIDRLVTWDTGMAAIVAIGLVKTSWLWLPLLIAPWSSGVTRLACSLAVGGGVLVATVARLGTDEFNAVNTCLLRPVLPSFLQGLLVSFPLAGVAYGARIVLRREWARRGDSAVVPGAGPDVGNSADRLVPRS